MLTPKTTSLTKTISLLKSKMNYHPLPQIKICWGYVNLYMNPKLDKIDNMMDRHDNPVYRKLINSLLESMNLTVCFRDIYSSLR